MKNLLLLGIMLSLLACSLGSWGSQQSTVIPISRPVNFEIQTALPTPKIAMTATPTRQDDTAILPLQDVPTSTPEVLPTATFPIFTTPTNTPIPSTDTPEPTEESDEVAASDEVVDDTTSEVPNTPVPFDGELDPPLAGGVWDFEGEFLLWENPYGDCSGALVGAGWAAFVEEGPLGSSCMGENLFPQDVQSGAKSQEITFDFIIANSGIYRTIETKPGHQYKIVAHAKHVRSLAPVQMFLGIDMTGGTIWQAEAVQWFAWDDALEDVFTMTEETVTATGETMTIFIRGYHPQGDQGGKTYIDNVSVTHLGP
jgi:hypothetical protein